MECLGQSTHPGEESPDLKAVQTQSWMDQGDRMYQLGNLLCGRLDWPYLAGFLARLGRMTMLQPIVPVFGSLPRLTYGSSAISSTRDLPSTTEVASPRTLQWCGTNRPFCLSGLDSASPSSQPMLTQTPQSIEANTVQIRLGGISIYPYVLQLLQLDDRLDYSHTSICGRIRYAVCHSLSDCST